MKLFALLLCPVFLTPAFAASETPPSESIISEQVAKQFKELGGSAKALKHLSCVFKNQRKTRFGLKTVKDKKNQSLVEKCNKVEGGKAEISINRDDYALVIDYTKPASARRMFLIPVTGEGKVEAYYVGHGRFGNTPRDNTKASAKGNSLDSLKLFSNKENNNSTATGLYVAGKSYFGKYNGPKKDIVKKNKKGKKRTITVMEDPKNPKYSLVLQGVETQVNDNACVRATVIHGTSKISEAGKEEGVHLMSSGCPMVDYRAVNHIIEKTKGSTDKGGAAILSFGPREAALDDNYYCEMRADQQSAPLDEPKIEVPVQTDDGAGDEKDVTVEDDAKQDAEQDASDEVAPAVVVKK